MTDSSGINNHAEVVEAFRINVSDAGAVPAASTINTGYYNDLACLELVYKCTLLW